MSLLHVGHMEAHSAMIVQVFLLPRSLVCPSRSPAAHSPDLESNVLYLVSHLQETPSPVKGICSDGLHDNPGGPGMSS